MIIFKEEIIANSDQCKTYKSESYNVYYKGFVYSSKLGAGTTVFEEILKCIDANDFTNISKLYGAFCIFIKDIKNETIYAFTDNSGLYKAYFSGTIFSANFIQLPELLEEKPELDINSITEFLHFGFIHFENTFYKQIKKLDQNYIYKICKNQVSYINKKLPDFESNCNFNPVTYFKELSKAIEKEKISIDITGGVDSRLIAGAMDCYDANFELAISGNSWNSDMIIADKIGKLLNKKFYPYYHKLDNLNENELLKLFFDTDSSLDIISYHRIYKYLESRKNRGITFHLSGDGGALYKDFWWLQDFPFYRKKKSNIKKLYDIRIEPIKFKNDVLSAELSELSKNLQKQLIDRFSEYTADINTKTYDHLYYQYKRIVSGNYISSASKSFKSYTPLLEYDFIRYAYKLPRRKRIYGNFHRNLISFYNKELSLVKTSSGLTASSSKVYKFRDFVIYSYDILKRFLKQVLRKLLGKTYLQQSPNHPELYENIRNMDIFDKVITELKEQNVLNKDVDKNQINNSLTGKLFTLYFFYKNVHNKLKE